MGPQVKAPSGTGILKSFAKASLALWSQRK